MKKSCLFIILLMVCVLFAACTGKPGEDIAESSSEEDGPPTDTGSYYSAEEDSAVYPTVEEELLPENLQSSYNKIIGNYVKEQQELYGDRRYLEQSVSVSGEAGSLDYTIVYSFTGEGVDLTLTKSRDKWYEFVLDYKGEELIFQGGGWDILRSPDYYDVYFRDITGDGQDELVIMYTERAVLNADDGICIKVVELASLTLLDTAAEADNEAVESQVRERKDQEELNKAVSVQINDLKEKYGDSGDARVYIRCDAVKSEYYIIVVENGVVSEGKCINAGSSPATARQLLKDQAEDIFLDDSYKTVGIRILN